MKKSNIVILMLLVFALISSSTYSDILTVVLNDTNSIDTYLDKSAPSTNYGTSLTLQIQPYDATFTKRVLIKPNLSAIPEGSIIHNATLRLYLDLTAGSGLITVNLHPITKNWVETQANWGNYSTGNAWATAGGDYDAGIIGNFSINTTLGYYDIALNTTILTSELNNASYYGWLLKGTNEASLVNNKVFNSSEALIGSRPQLIVNLTLPPTVYNLSYYNFTVRNALTNASLSNFSLNISGLNYTNTFIQDGVYLYQERSNQRTDNDTYETIPSYVDDGNINSYSQGNHSANTQLLL